jgi:hypothetical protein
VGQFAAFIAIALFAGNNTIFPRCDAAAASRNDVIDRYAASAQLLFAILAAPSVPIIKDFFSKTRRRRTYVSPLQQAYRSWYLKLGRRGGKVLVPHTRGIPQSDDLNATFHQQTKGLNVAHKLKWRPVGVEK